VPVTQIVFAFARASTVTVEFNFKPAPALAEPAADLRRGTSIKKDSVASIVRLVTLIKSTALELVVVASVRLPPSRVIALAAAAAAQVKAPAPSFVKTVLAEP